MDLQNLKEIMTLREACEVLGVSERALGNEIRSGQLKAYKRLNKWFILKTDLIAYVTTGEGTTSVLLT